MPKTKSGAVLGIYRQGRGVIDGLRECWELDAGPTSAKNCSKDSYRNLIPRPPHLCTPHGVSSLGNNANETLRRPSLPVSLIEAALLGVPPHVHGVLRSPLYPIDFVRREIVIKDTHRGLWYENGVLVKIVDAGRYKFCAARASPTMTVSVPP